MLTRKIVLTLLITIFFSSLVFSAGYPEMPWYQVQDWEKKVCEHDAGVDRSTSYSSEPYGYNYVYQTTVALQAQSSAVPNSNLTKYELAWYIRPLTEQVTFKIEIKGSGDTEYLQYAVTDMDGTFLIQESVQPGTGTSGYFAFYLKSSYMPENAIMTYDSTSLEVPFVEN